MSFIETGTPATGPFFNDTVAVPLYVVDAPFVVGLPLILKSVIVCLWGALPFNITMLNVALNVGELELTFLKSHAPETIHAGFPSFPFCRLAIVPDFEPGCCALMTETDDINVAATAAMTIADSNSFLYFDIIKNRRTKSLINRTTRLLPYYALQIYVCISVIRQDTIRHVRTYVRIIELSSQLVLDVTLMDRNVVRCVTYSLTGKDSVVHAAETN